MKLKNVCLMLIVLVMVVGLIPNTVKAATVFNLNLQTTQTTIKKGDTFSVQINLSNVTDTTGISGYQAKIVYDSNVLTLVEVSSDEWETAEYNGAIVANTKDALGTSTGVTAIAKFKVNDDTQSTSTTITISDILGANGDIEEVDGTVSPLNIIIGESSGGNNSDTNNATNNSTTNNTTNNNNSGTNNNTNNGSNTNSNSNNNGSGTGTGTGTGSGSGSTNKNTANGTIPYAGEYNIMTIIMAVAVIGAISYFKFRKYNV